MLGNICFVVLCLGTTVSASTLDLASPAVFSPVFYVNTNPEVTLQNILSADEARQHWLTTGLKAGLQGCGSFHADQYLQRYPDLARKFVMNYTAAAEHYLTVGQKQGLLGYVEGGFDGRYTISDVTGQLFVSVSERMGGAVDSVVSDDTEFINAWDHGRELQMAINLIPNGPCYNPTEAGGRDDARNATTKTKILDIKDGNGTLRTMVWPAFWLRAGDTETHVTPVVQSKCQKGDKAINKQDIYYFPFAKTISMSCPGVGDDICFTYQATVTVGLQLPEYSLLQVEGPTGYLTGEFNVSCSLDVKTGELVPYNSTKPLVISSGCLQHAFGLWAPPGQDTDLPQTYGSMPFDVHNFAAATYKWNVAWHKKPIPSMQLPQVLDYTVHICVGTQAEVAKCLMKLIHFYEKTV